MKLSGLLMLSLINLPNVYEARKAKPFENRFSALSKNA